MKLEFSQQIFKKYSNIRFNENPFSDCQEVPCGPTDMQTDGHDKANMINNDNMINKQNGRKKNTG